MKICTWGPWVDLPGLKPDDYRLYTAKYMAAGLVGLFDQCGWLFVAERQIVLYDAAQTTFRTVDADRLFHTEDYRRPLAAILERNTDLLNDVQIKILTSTAW